MTLERFLTELGSKKGAPGGGAAAALTGASGSALVEMVARLNDARLKRSSGTADRARVLRQKFLGLMKEDAKAFARIQGIYRSRKTRKAAWQAALKNGAAVPLRMAEACVRAAELARAEKGRTSRWLESDRREARLLLRAALEAAWLNVEVNLNGMTDRSFTARAKRRIGPWRRRLQRS